MYKSPRSTWLALAATTVLLGIPFVSFNSGAAPTPRPQAANIVACRVMEAHTSAELRVVTVVFHQKDKNDGPRLGALLGKHSGTTVEFQTADGVWHRAQVFRLKSCFGRGLLVFAAGEAQLAERRDFGLKFPADYFRCRAATEPASPCLRR
jgi:hypothetical protein